MSTPGGPRPGGDDRSPWARPTNGGSSGNDRPQQPWGGQAPQQPWGAQQPPPSNQPWPGQQPPPPPQSWPGGQQPAYQQWPPQPGGPQPPYPPSGQWGGPGGPSGPPSRLPLIIGAVVIAVLLIGGGLWWATRPAETGTTTTPTATSRASRPPASTRPTTAPRTTAPGTTAPDPRPTGAPAQTGQVGQPVRFQTDTGAGELIVHEVRWSTDGIIPPDHGAYLGLDVEITVSEGTHTYGPIYFSATDSSGREYTIAVGGRDKPQLGFGRLSAGQKARGWVTVDCPRTELTVAMDDAMMEPAAYVQVKP